MLEYALLGIALVATEEFVATIASQHDLDAVLARHLGAEISGCCRGIAEGLIVGAGDQRHGLDHVVGSHIVFMRLGAEMARGDTGKFQLVKTLLVETDREGFSRLAADLAQHAADGGAVGAAGEEGAGGALLVVLACHTLLGELHEALTQCGVVAAVVDIVAKLPVKTPRQRVAGKADRLCRQQLFHPDKRGVRAGHHVAIEVFVKRLLTDGRRHEWVAGNCARAGREHEGLADKREAQALDAAAIDGQHHPALAPIDQHHGEIALHGLQDMLVAIAPGGEHGCSLAV